MAWRSVSALPGLTVEAALNSVLVLLSSLARYVESAWRRRPEESEKDGMDSAQAANYLVAWALVLLWAGSPVIPVGPESLTSER